MLYEVIGTSLWNGAMPLVRYATGDLVRVPRSYGRQELIEVAYGLRPFDGIIGRTLDILLAPDAKGVLTGINQIPRSVEHLLRLQIVQDAPDHVILRALVSADFSAADADHLMRNARQKIPGSVRIDLEVVDKLERTPLGKTPFILHSPQVKELLRATGYYVDES
jgi:phenylacetate-CoA ligase